jgi:8-oxo-dGTP pyrophosphatase MutT (NUDIX family)
MDIVPLDNIMTRDTYKAFLDDLKKRLDAYRVREIHKEDLRPASVFMLFMMKEGEPHILLTKRTEKVKDHKGQISFPGGAYDKEDGDLLATAYRETLEEVGIPERDIEYIGRFDDYISVSGYRVSTFIGSVKYPVKYDFNEHEIDEHIEVPFSLFSNRNFDRVEKFNMDGVEYIVYYYIHQGHEIWGLTARIITDFVKKILRK